MSESDFSKHAKAKQSSNADKERIQGSAEIEEAIMKVINSNDGNAEEKRGYKNNKVSEAC